MPTHPVQPPEWIDAAPMINEESVEIDVAPSVVWGHVADHERWPEWFTDLDEVVVTGEATGVGGGRRVTISRVTIDEEFTAWDTDKRFAFAIVRSPIPFLSTVAESVEIEPTDDGCRVTYRQGLQARRGFGRVLSVATRRMPGQLRAALGNLKVLAESG